MVFVRFRSWKLACLFFHHFLLSDPGYTLFAKFGFKLVLKQVPAELVPLTIVLWWQMFACSIVSFILSSTLVKDRMDDVKEAFWPGKATFIMIVLNAGAQSMQMAALGWVL